MAFTWGVSFVIVYSDVKHGGFLLSGLTAATTTILLELAPFFMLPDPGPKDSYIFTHGSKGLALKHEYIKSLHCEGQSEEVAAWCVRGLRPADDGPGNPS